jgi:LmbE family N-acetylglucosaminyl deacetylase
MDVFSEERKRVGVIVAHPDDETLWAGGTLLLHPAWQVTIITLCRGDDLDRAPKFARVCAALGAEGRMGTLDDGPTQAPLDPGLVQQTIRDLLDGADFDLLFTHGPDGEYTWHRRHVEVSAAVTALREAGVLAAPLCQFAYEDGGRAYLPRPRAAAVTLPLPQEIWTEKYRLITEVYGFARDSWEARATPRTEAFTVQTAPLIAYTGKRGHCRP